MKKSAFSAVGISSLLVIFAVLCLAVFALLSVSTVQAQNRLAESSREAVLGYYRADCEAETVLAALPITLDSSSFLSPAARREIEGKITFEMA